MNNGIITNLLDWAYNKAIVGFTGLDSAYDLANSYMNQKGSLDQRVNSLIKWQVAKAATSGFVMGLGGVMSMPVTVPANVASVIYMQIRMIAAIAYMGGHDIKSDKVKSMIYICMVGNSAKELLKDVGVKTGEKVMTKILEKVSTKLLSKIGEQGVSTLGKAIPVFGGVVGGSFDAVSTNIVGRVAKKTFINKDSDYYFESLEN